MGKTGAAVCALLLASLVHSQEPIRIGMVNVLTGQFAEAGVQLDNGVKSALKRCGTVAGRRIDVIRHDTGGVAPEVARRLARDLVMRDKADILAGLVLTANALAVAEVSAETRRLLVVMGAGGAGILAKSPYAIRTSASAPSSAATRRPAARGSPSSGTRPPQQRTSCFFRGATCRRGLRRTGCWSRSPTTRRSTTRPTGSSRRPSSPPTAAGPTPCELVQTVYIGEARRVGGEIVSVPIDRLAKIGR